MSARRLLLLVIGLAANAMFAAAQSAVPSASPACNPWTSAANTNYAGGTSTTSSTLTECQNLCIATATCIAVDWNPAAGAGLKCWTFTSLSGTKFSGGTSGINHYDLNRQCLSTSGVSSLPPTCTPIWTASANTNYAGGVSNSASDVLSCQASCLARSTCVGIDWNPNAGAGARCWTLDSLAGTKFSGSNSGITHYDLNRTCAAGANKLVEVKTGGVLTANTNDYSVRFLGDINAATILVQTQCLAATLSGFNSTQNCVSWYSADNPGYYLRNLWGTVSLEPRSPQLFPDRFAQDASFYVIQDQFYKGYWAVQPVVWPNPNYFFANTNPNILMAISQDTSQSFNNSASFYISDYTASGSAVTSSCPYVWTRIKGAAGTLDNSLFRYLSLADCRKWCLTYPYCIGVTYQEYQRCFLQLDGPSGGPLTPNQQYSYFELTPSIQKTCKPGCTYTWNSRTFYFTGYVTSSNDDPRTCRSICISTGCVGIAIATNGTTFTCTRYVNYVVSNGYINATVTISVPTTTFVGCGACSPQTNIVTFTTDANAVLQSGITGEMRCLTACINNRFCSGFDLNNNNNYCYLSLTSNPVLSSSLTTHHFEITRSSCGNGCADKWDYYPYTSMQGGTVQPTYTTERACRQACQVNDTCYQFDWLSVNSTCYFGGATVPLNVLGTSPGWVHYNYNGEYYCDEDSSAV